jgi:hypothetical protein
MKGNDKEMKKDKDKKKRNGIRKEKNIEKEWIKQNKKREDNPEPINKVTHEPK